MATSAPFISSQDLATNAAILQQLQNQLAAIAGSTGPGAAGVSQVALGKSAVDGPTFTSLLAQAAKLIPPNYRPQHEAAAISKWLPSASISIDRPYTQTPTIPTIVAAGGTSVIVVSWSAVPGANTYDLQKSPDGITWTTIPALQATIYTDTSAPPNTGYYYYRVRTNSFFGVSSPYSAVVNASPYNVWDKYYYNGSSDAYEYYQQRGDYRFTYPVPLFADVPRIGGPVAGQPNFLVTADGTIQGYSLVNYNAWLTRNAYLTTYSFSRSVTIPTPAIGGGVCCQVGWDNNSGLFADVDIGGHLILYSVSGGTFTSVTSQSLTVTAGATYNFLVTVSPTSVNITVTQQGNSNNTATIVYNSSPFGSNTRYGIWKDGAATGTVSFGEDKMWSSLGTPVAPAPPTFSLLSVSDAFIDSNGTAITSHVVAPTNATSGTWGLYQTSGDANFAESIQSNQLRLTGSRDSGAFAYLSSIAAPDGMMMQVDGTFDSTNGSAWGLGPESNNQASLGYINTPNIAYELTTYPPNQGFASLPGLTTGQLLAIYCPGVFPISAQTNGGATENANSVANLYFPMPLGSQWRLQVFIDTLQNPPAVWIYAGQWVGGQPPTTLQLLHYGFLFLATASANPSQQKTAWTGVQLNKGGDVPTGQVISVNLANLLVYCKPQTGGVFDAFVGTNGTTVVGRTPAPTNDANVTWSKLSGTNMTATIQSNRLQIIGSSGATISCWGFNSGFTSTLTIGGIFNAPAVSGAFGGLFFGMDATAQNGWYWEIEWDTGTIFLRQVVAGSATAPSGWTNVGIGAMTANVDYVFTAIVNGTALSLYINGVQVATYTMASGLTNGYAGILGAVGNGIVMNHKNFTCHA